MWKVKSYDDCSSFIEVFVSLYLPTYARIYLEIDQLLVEKWHIEAGDLLLVLSITEFITDLVVCIFVYVLCFLNLFFELSELQCGLCIKIEKLNSHV